MGDAGLPPAELTQLYQQVPDQKETEQRLRDIHVLVTGFGPFNTFTTNPSWLIASSLPSTLEAQPELPAQPQTQDQQRVHPLASLLISQVQSNPQFAPPTPLRPPNTHPYKIHIHTHPSPLRVSYPTTAELIPTLLNQQSYDYILHIGLASGRDSYTLETQAHRDSYAIPDIDGASGQTSGSQAWRAQGVPERLDVGWEGSDVLRRWVAEVEERQPAADKDTEARQRFATSHGILGLRGGVGARMGVTVARRAVVKLSRDAGRFLCEFVLMCSLAWRWQEGVQAQEGDDDLAREKLGKVAFLHVPNGIEATDVSRGVMVAESAIRAIVASWEAGYRNPLVYAPLADAVTDSTQLQEKQKEKAVIDVGFETRSTGDAMPTGSA